ncbi:MAG: MFS transporter [Comamonadaceae bacterium]|nr:MFS transporter [Comamonadaceae bacterium]
MSTSTMSRRTAVLVFVAFAAAYFLSALIRAITATLSPALTHEFVLSAGDLGLLAGGYFLGFAATQLPLGSWLDQYGPKKVVLSLLTAAVAGCAAFAMAISFNGLLLARVLSGIGVSACLMAPLTGYRRWYAAASQMRANSWMLMTGSLGMLASTLPVQWLMPLIGWRPLFWGLAALVLLAMALIAWQVPDWPAAAHAPTDKTPASSAQASYAEVWRHPFFRKMAPMGFFIYGGLVAMQTLWVTPWLIRVSGWTDLEAANGMFWLNMAMLLTFLCWGLLNPWLARRGYGAEQLITYGMPLSFTLLALLIVAGSEGTYWAGAAWALYCMACSFVALAQPAVAMAFPSTLAGRALSAYNLLIFSGVFVVQWGVGLIIDALKALDYPEVQAFQYAMGIYLLCTLGSYVYFLTAKSHNHT